MAFDLISELESKTALMTVAEVATILRVNPTTVYKMAAARRIPSFLIGGKRLFDPAQLIRWVTKKNPRIMEGRAARSDAASPNSK